MQKYERLGEHVRRRNLESMEWLVLILSATPFGADCLLRLSETVKDITDRVEGVEDSSEISR